MNLIAAVNAAQIERLGDMNVIDSPACSFVVGSSGVHACHLDRLLLFD
jgi:hypothetical protein